MDGGERVVEVDIDDLVRVLIHYHITIAVRLLLD